MLSAKKLYVASQACSPDLTRPANPDGIRLGTAHFWLRLMDLVVFALTISALAILISCLFCTIGFGLFMQRRIRLK